MSSSDSSDGFDYSYTHESSSVSVEVPVSSNDAEGDKQKLLNHSYIVRNELTIQIYWNSVRIPIGEEKVISSGDVACLIGSKTALRFDLELENNQYTFKNIFNYIAPETLDGISFYKGDKLDHVIDKRHILVITTDNNSDLKFIVAKIL